MNITTSIKGLSLALLLSLGFSAKAMPSVITMDAAEDQAKKTFDLMDTDKDGLLDKTEVATFMFNKIKKMVGDKIPEDKLRAMVKQQVIKMFAMIDADKDEKISFEELKAARPKKP